MSFVPRPQEIYKHFKGNLYQITAVAEHTETGEQLVVYQALYGDFKTYARPLSMFVSKVDREKYPNAVQEFRFELQGPEAGRQREERESMFVEDEGAVYTAESLAGARPDMAEAEGRATVAATDSLAEELGMDKVRGAMPAGEYPAGTLEEEPALDPLLLEYLDSDSYEERMNILTALHSRITDEMITTMAIVSDLEIGEGDTEERYHALRSCLETLRHYECDRLR